MNMFLTFFYKILIILVCILNLKTTYAITDLCSGPNDIIFLLDTSTSIQDSNLPGQTQDNWSLIRSFIKQVVSNLTFNKEPALRVGIIPFSSQIHQNFNFQLFDQKNATLQNIDEIEYRGGNTNTSGALRQARYIFQQDWQPNHNKIIVLVTDGQSNVDSDLTLIEAKINQALNITHFAVAITSYVNVNELLSIINNDPAYYYIAVANFLNLSSHVTKLSERISCSTPTETGCENIKYDICFLLDSSQSIVGPGEINMDNWDYMKQFLVDIVTTLGAGADTNHFALIDFSTKANVIFKLNYSFSTNIINQKIRRLKLIGQNTNTGEALSKMKAEVFTGANGDRPDVPNVAIVVTDGKSNTNVGLTIPNSEIAKKAGIQIFAIGLTNEINMAELQGIASTPWEEHVFTRDTIALVSTVVNNLIWKICHPICTTNCTRLNLCPPDYSPSFQKLRGTMIKGPYYKVLENVVNDTSCQNQCLQDVNCKSIEYVKRKKLCNLLKFRQRDVSPSTIVSISGTEYYEWICVLN